MLSGVFYAIPTDNPDKCTETFAKWRAMGYGTAALVDGDAMAPGNADLVVRVLKYRGWPWATNRLCQELVASTSTEWVIAGGDDMDPDPNIRAEDIAAQCATHFGGTGGVMQPTGDPWGIDASGRCAAERICGSPWLGRSFILSRVGAVFNENYRHFFADEQLHDELINTGLLWQRKDLSHFHRHWNRTGEARPPHSWQESPTWAHDEAVFRTWQKTRRGAKT